MSYSDEHIIVPFRWRPGKLKKAYLSIAPSSDLWTPMFECTPRSNIRVFKYRKPNSYCLRIGMLMHKTCIGNLVAICKWQPWKNKNKAKALIKCAPIYSDIYSSFSFGCPLAFRSEQSRKQFFFRPCRHDAIFWPKMVSALQFSLRNSGTHLWSLTLFLLLLVSHMEMALWRVILMT